MNVLSWILTGLIIIAVVLAVRFLYRHRGAGCTGNCVECVKKMGCSEVEK
ncbi:MAG: hypothetical protein Q4G60_03405 [bacterium]|nr:hypothetical protein [bacterium]